MKVPPLTRFIPGWKNAGLAILSAILLILAFPDFEFWFLAWFALAPLIWAVERERESIFRSFMLGWLWGLVFFFGTCWWLTFAPITYAGFPPILAYFLMLCVSVVVGIFPGVFAAILAFLYQRFGNLALLAAPFVWVFSEFLRYWLTGNNWNAIGYSQAFSGYFVGYSSLGGVYLTSFVVLLVTGAAVGLAVWAISGLIWMFDSGRLVSRNEEVDFVELEEKEKAKGPVASMVWAAVPLGGVILMFFINSFLPDEPPPYSTQASVVAIQPNVPMSGLNQQKWEQLRTKHVELTESALKQLSTGNRLPTTVIFPESPMNFMWNDDLDFQRFVKTFAAKHDVQVLFNSAEPDGANNKYFNSAVLVGPDGKEVAQYDKIYLLPFGESVPAPLQSIVPAFVGSFSYGKEYDLLPLGDAKAGVMICFESHFGELGREYVRGGADVLIEMTNDGYLGPTPVLRQHLANAVFRAVETNRPVLRVTNVGITAYINERGEVSDAADPYTEATRVWSVATSDGLQTLYVRYGDWFAWMCSAITIGLVLFAIARGRRHSVPST